MISQRHTAVSSTLQMLQSLELDVQLLILDIFEAGFRLSHSS